MEVSRPWWKSTWKSTHVALPRMEVCPQLGCSLGTLHCGDRIKINQYICCPLSLFISNSAVLVSSPTVAFSQEVPCAWA